MDNVKDEKGRLPMFYYSSWGRKIVGVEDYVPKTKLKVPEKHRFISDDEMKPTKNQKAQPDAESKQIEVVEIKGNRMMPVFTLAIGAIAGVFGHKFYQDFTALK